MADEFIPVKLGFRVEALPRREIQGILNEITVELSDPNSRVSRQTADLGISVQSLEVQEQPAFVIRVAFLIGMAVKFAGGAASAGGALFFNKVIKPRIIRKRSDGIGDPIEPNEIDSND